MEESLEIEAKIWEYIGQNFDMKGEYTRLSRENPLDFISMRCTVAEDGKRIQIDNDFKL